MRLNLLGRAIALCAICRAPVQAPTLQDDQKILYFWKMNTIIKDANRYVLNAREILEENAIRENGQYLDKKYIKMAGHTAYVGVLLALDQLIEPSATINQKKIKRKSVDHCRAFLTNYDKKMLSNFNDLYNILHLDLGYDGLSDAIIIKRGMSMAKEFIYKVAVRLN